MASPSRPTRMLPPTPLHDLSIEAPRTTSPSHTSASSSPNTSEPESQDATPLAIDPAVIAGIHWNNEHASSTLEHSASPRKQAGLDMGNDVPNPDVMITINSPTLDLVNPYEVAPGLRKALSTTDLHESQARTSVDSDSTGVQRLPSVLRPAHPRFADSIGSRRASMALLGDDFGLPPPTEEEQKSFPDLTGKTPMHYSRRSISPDEGRPFPTDVERPYGTAGRESFTPEAQIPFASTEEGLTVSPMLDGERIRRHSAAVTSPRSPPVFRHTHSASASAVSSPVSHPGSEPRREDQRFTDLWPEVPTGTVKKRASRWKFWTN